MNKRQFLGTLLGQSKSSKTNIPVVTTLDPYNGTWGWTEAQHLLTRASFSPSPSEIQQSIDLGLEGTLDALFDLKPLDPPIHFKYNGDPWAPIGESWVNQPWDNSINGLRGARRTSSYVWMIGMFYEAGMSIQERMILFWHEHMPVGALGRGEFNYEYYSKIEKNALGNYRSLLEEMTISNAMLQYLNGNENTQESPNENYARELLELFTIGRGAEVGPGDYTNYTELDVTEIARALTGWRTFADVSTGEIGSVFVNNRHDSSDKQLSIRFDETTISNGGAEEYKTVIDIILQKMEVARYICRQLHIWFVGPEITDEVESNVIEPLAQMFYSNNYEIAPVVRTLLSSQYFNDHVHHGCLVSSPIDFLTKLTRAMDLDTPNETSERYFLWEGIASASEVMGMQAFEIPSVAGWKAYYQGPLYDKAWVNSVSLVLRQGITDILLSGIQLQGFQYRYDLLKYIENIPDATDPNLLIDGIAERLFVVPLSNNQKGFLKEVLIGGLPDFEWTVEYGEYLGSPDNQDLKTSVENKLLTLFSAMFKMPEFYLY